MKEPIKSLEKAAATQDSSHLHEVFGLLQWLVITPRKAHKLVNSFLVEHRAKARWERHAALKDGKPDRTQKIRLAGSCHLNIESTPVMRHFLCFSIGTLCTLFANAPPCRLHVMNLCRFVGSLSRTATHPIKVFFRTKALTNLISRCRFIRDFLSCFCTALAI